MATRLTRDEWIAARIAWENDPTMTGAQLAVAVGISRQSVNERMKRAATAGDPWEKKVTRAEMAQRAMAAADKKPAAPSPPPIEVPKVDPENPDAEPDAGVRKPDGVTTAEHKKPQDLLPIPDPVQARADVIDRHRREWSVARGLVGEAVKGRNFDKAKLAKITSETLNIIQKSERTAWGLDALDPDDKPVVIIDRTSKE